MAYRRQRPQFRRKRFHHPDSRKSKQQRGEQLVRAEKRDVWAERRDTPPDTWDVEDWREEEVA